MTKWTDDPDEIKALESLHEMVGGWVEALYAVPETRYANPADNHRVD